MIFNKVESNNKVIYNFIIIWSYKYNIILINFLIFFKLIFNLKKNYKYYIFI